MGILTGFKVKTFGYNLVFFIEKLHLDRGIINIIRLYDIFVQFFAVGYYLDQGLISHLYL